jgi:hypothetical protein
VNEEPAYAGQLNDLAKTAGVSIPNLTTQVAVAAPVVVSAPEVEPVPGMTDAATVRAFFKAHSGRRSGNGSFISREQANAAATRLGDAGVLKLVARWGIGARLDFAEVAFRGGWLSPTLATLDALCLVPDQRGLMLDTLYKSSKDGLADEVSASELTAWVGANQTRGLVAAMRLWTKKRFPDGVIDDDVVVSLGMDMSSREQQFPYHEQSTRLSVKSVRYLCERNPALTSVALRYAVELSTKDLVGLYDLVNAKLLESEDCAESVSSFFEFHALRPIVEAMCTSGATSRAVLARAKEFILAGGERTPSHITAFVLANLKLNDDELSRLLTTFTFVKWLDGDYVKNQPKRTTAVAVASKLVLTQVFHTTASRLGNGGEIVHPERYEWFISQLAEEAGFPMRVREVLKHGERNDLFSIGTLGVKVANKAFASATPEVRKRLWRSLAAQRSFFDGPGLVSFNRAVSEFEARTATAAARVAARKANAV